MATESEFTPLDSLKECAARANLALANAIEVINTPGALALPDAVERLTFELSELHQILCVEAINAHIDMRAPDAQHYSDGRPVRTQLPLETDIVHQQVWSADRDSARDRAQVVAEIRTPSDTHWRIVILRPGEVDAVRVADSDE